MKIIKQIIINFLKAYKYIISPLLGNNCRFYPSCSDYSMEAIDRFGPVKGSILTAKRIVKCQPFHKGGMDPVPPHTNIKSDTEAETHLDNNKECA